jgi:hypothetical protein
MSTTNYLENALLNAVFRNTSYTSVATVYVKLHTADPGEDATNNAASETTRTAATFGAPSNGVITNSGDITWSSVSTSETYSHISIWDAPTGGNPLAYGALDASVPITAGGDFTIPTGQLSITLT